MADPEDEPHSLCDGCGRAMPDVHTCLVCGAELCDDCGHTDPCHETEDGEHLF